MPYCIDPSDMGMTFVARNSKMLCQHTPYRYEKTAARYHTSHTKIYPITADRVAKLPKNVLVVTYAACIACWTAVKYLLHGLVHKKIETERRYLC